MLPLVVGRATRLAQFMTGVDKVYEATIAFGRETDTYDAAGQTTRETGEAPDAAALAAAVARLPGRRLQTPPVYSAKKIGGEASHRLARRDTPVVPAPVEVEVHEAELVGDRDLRGAASGYASRPASTCDPWRTTSAPSSGSGAHLAPCVASAPGRSGSTRRRRGRLVVAGGAALRAAVVPLERLLLHLPLARCPTAPSSGSATASRWRRRRPTTAPAAGPVRLLDPAGTWWASAPRCPAPAEGRSGAFCSRS